MARLEAAFTTVPAGKTNVVAYLMAATGATRSNVRTWLRNGRKVRRLGRPTFFIVGEEATIAVAMELWTANGGLLTREMMATILRDYVADMGAERKAQAKAYFGDDVVPGKTWFAAFLRRRPELRRVTPAGLDEARARAAISEAVAKYFAALTAVTRQYDIESASQVYNTDESTISVADVLRGCGRQAYTTSPTRRRADFVTPVCSPGRKPPAWWPASVPTVPGCRSSQSCAEARGACRTCTRRAPTAPPPWSPWPPSWGRAPRSIGVRTPALTGTSGLSTHVCWLSTWARLRQPSGSSC